MSDSNVISQLWRDLLLDLKRRGLTTAPQIAVADGALGFWKALGEVWPTAREQRCWVHKTANILKQDAEEPAHQSRRSTSRERPGRNCRRCRRSQRSPAGPTAAGPFSTCGKRRNRPSPKRRSIGSPSSTPSRTRPVSPRRPSDWRIAPRPSRSERAAALYSILQTAKLNGVNPQA